MTATVVRKGHVPAEYLAVYRERRTLLWRMIGLRRELAQAGLLNDDDVRALFAAEAVIRASMYTLRVDL